MRPVLWLTAALILVPSLALAQSPTPPVPPSAPAPAAPPPDPRLNFCIKAAGQVQNQREAALNATAQCNAQLDLEHEDLVKVQGENADLKKKADEAAKDLVKVQDAAAKAQAENVELKKKLAAVPPPAPRPPSAQ